jgi:hypothetical protein
VTSASLTWNRPAAPEAADYGREYSSSRFRSPKIGYLVADLKEDPNDPATSKQRRAARRSRGRARKASPLANGSSSSWRSQRKDSRGVGGINTGWTRKRPSAQNVQSAGLT